MHGTITRRKFTQADLDAIECLAQAEARESLWAFRQYMRPNMLKGWWVRELSGHGQEFYEDYVAGLRPKMVLEAPPQHGKSTFVIDLIAWISGKCPDSRHIFTSYGEALGRRTNMALQRIFSSEKYRAIFPELRISDMNVVTMAGRWLRNSDVIEFVDREGSFRNTTIGGQITGQSLDLGYIDDPIKGRKEANSVTIRNGTWDWLTDDFFTRFAEKAGFIMVMTRWHVDDPVARFLEKFPETNVIKYKAIAEKNERYRKKGEPLFPEFKSLEFLEERRRAMTQASFEAVYQQEPYVSGGGMFPVENFEIVTHVNKSMIERSVRYWDKAGTDSDDGATAHTAGVLMHKMRDGADVEFVISDVVRVQKSALAREKLIKQTADLDATTYGHGRVQQWIEQEPGSGGKESAETTVRNLAGHTVRVDKVTGNKIVRAEPYAAQVEAGNIALVGGDWVREFLDEHEVAPHGKTKDQWDAAAGAFNKLTVASKYDSSMSWV